MHNPSAILGSTGSWVLRHRPDTHLLWSRTGRQWLAAGLLALAGFSAHGQNYTFTDLGTLGGSTSVGSRINKGGSVAGSSLISGDSFWQATKWNGSQAVALGSLGGSTSYARDINRHGQVVGESSLNNQFLYHPVLWNGTVPTDLGTLGGTVGYARAINDSGVIVGATYLQFDQQIHATL